MLKCETNTPEIKLEIQAEAYEYFIHSEKFKIEHNKIDVFFELKQWYLSFYDIREEKYRNYSVCDASYKGIDYYEFEEL